MVGPWTVVDDRTSPRVEEYNILVTGSNVFVTLVALAF